MAKLNRLSRRALVGGFMASATVGISRAQTPESSPNAEPGGFAFPDPIIVHDSVHVLDWRPFPAPDGPSFIAEVRNVGDDPIAAPTIGLTFAPDSGSPEYTWGNPWNVSLAPNQSTFVFGKLDIDEPGQDALDAATWSLCGDDIEIIDGRLPQSFMTWSETELTLNDRWGQIDTVLTNHKDEPARWYMMTAIVRDSHGRVAGGSFVRSAPNLEPNESRALSLYVQHYEIDSNWSSEHAANPYYILEPDEPWTADLTVDIRGNLVNAGCSSIMPWNRDP